MPTRTARPLDVISDDAVLEVLGSESVPLSTRAIRQRLAARSSVPLGDVVMSRLRRTLERLTNDEMIVASGGKRGEMPGWPKTDGRYVLWTSRPNAARLQSQYYSRIEQQMEANEERALILRHLHSILQPHERSALGLVGVLSALRHDPTFEDEDGATTWTLEALRVVSGLAEEARC